MARPPFPGQAETTVPGHRMKAANRSRRGMVAMDRVGWVRINHREEPMPGMRRRMAIRMIAPTGPMPRRLPG